jgi:hypothetical protein
VTLPLRLLRRALLLLLALYAVYLLLGNAFLNTALADAALNRHPERFQIRWQRALTLYPGHVRASGVEVRGHVRRFQWQARAATASSRIALLPLLRRELRLPRIDARDVGFESDRVDTDIAPREPKPGGWIVHLPRIETDSLRRARWNELELAGRGGARFGLWKQLRGGPFEILASSLELSEATLKRGDDTWLSNARIAAGFALDRHDGAAYPGRAKLALIVAHVRAEGAVTGVGLALGGDQEWTLTREARRGTARVDLGWERGALREASEVRLEVPVSLQVDDGPRRENTLALGLQVEADAWHLTARLPQQEQGRVRLDADLRIAQRGWPEHGLRALLPKTSGHVDLRWRFDSLRWLSDLLVRGEWLRFDGAGELDAALQIEAGQLAPGSRFEVPGVQLQTRVLGDRISGRAHAVGRIAPAAGAEPAQARVEVVLDEYAIASDDAPDQPYVEGRALRVELASAGTLAEFRDQLQARLQFAQARVPDLRRYNHYLPSAQLRFTSGSGTLDGDLALDAQGQVAHGTFAVRARGAGLRFARLDLGGDVAVDTRLRRADLAERKFDLDGSRIALSRVAFRDPSGVQRRDWWARIELPRAHGEWGRPLSLDGEARIAMKDVGFLLALFAQKKPFPRWVARLVDAGQAEVEGRARLRGKSLVLDRLQAENRRFRVQARLKLEDAQARGDLLLHWGVLGIGVELAPEERDWRLVKPTQWYESRPDFL